MKVKDIQHVCNPLHIFCRLIGCGLNPKAALLTARIYEFTIYQGIKIALRMIDEKRTNT
jgi:hypothetical protein